MSNTKAKEFLATIESDEAAHEKFRALIDADDREGFEAWAAQHGADHGTLKAILAQGSDELGEGELDAVSGGGSIGPRRFAFKDLRRASTTFRAVKNDPLETLAAGDARAHSVAQTLRGWDLL